MNLSKDNPEISYRDKFVRRYSWPKCAAFSTTFENNNQNNDAFNIKTTKANKILSKSYDGTQKYRMNVSSEPNCCKLFNSAKDNSITTQDTMFNMLRNLDSSDIIRSLSELNISDSLEKNLNVSEEKIFNDFDTLKNNDCINSDETSIIIPESVISDEISTVKCGNKNNHKIKSKDSNERSRFKYVKSDKKTIVDDVKNNETRECTQDETMHCIDKKCTKLKMKKERYNDKIRLYCLNNKVLIIMEEKTSFCFTGKVILNVLYGAIETYGIHRTSSNPPIEVYSPMGYGLAVIENSRKFMCDNKDIWTLLSQESINPDIKNKLRHDINRCKPGMAVITLINLENKLTAFINAYFSIKLFPIIHHVDNYSWTDIRRAEMILQSNLYFDNENIDRLVIDTTISKILPEKMLNRWRSRNRSCTLIAGGQQLGKSMAVSFLINNILSTSGMAIYVDLDPGQSACTPANSISYTLIDEPLTGPNFTHLKQPICQFYIGGVDVTRCITRYIESVTLLAKKLLNCQVMSRLPIIINTMGFNYGIGWDLIVFTIKLFQPSFVVQIMSENTRNNYPNLLNSDVLNNETLAGFSWNKNITYLNNQCFHELYVIKTNAEVKHKSMNESLKMKSYEKRELAMISYLSGIINPVKYSSFPSLNINEAVPYAASFDSVSIALLSKVVSPSRVLNEINGNIVALCFIDSTNNLLKKAIPLKPRVLTKVPVCACYGYGIIRGIDMNKEEIYILGPLPRLLMQYVNCLIGSMPIPENLLKLDRPNVSYAGQSNNLPAFRDLRKYITPRGHSRMKNQNRRTSD